MYENEIGAGLKAAELYNSVTESNPPLIITKYIRGGKKVWKTRKQKDGTIIATKERRNKRGLLVGIRVPDSEIYFIGYSLCNKNSVQYYMTKEDGSQVEIDLLTYSQTLLSNKGLPLENKTGLTKVIDRFDSQTGTIEALVRLLWLTKMRNEPDALSSEVTAYVQHIPDSIKDDFLSFNIRASKFFKNCTSFLDLMQK